MNITASVNYHVLRTEPQAFHFDVDGIVGNLVSPELAALHVHVQDVRHARRSVSFDDDGIIFLQAPSTAQPFNQEDAWQKHYEQEICALLSNTIGAKEVLVFDHTVRIDDSDAARKPARNVHNDYSCAGAHQRLKDLVGADKAAQYEQGHFGFVNVWRPIETPVVSSPLGFIRPSSVLQEDWMNIELIYPDRQGQILGLAANPNHEWFYQSNMTPNEVAIFNIYDNRQRPHLAHSALDVVGQSPSTPPRKSIETRTLVRYD